MGDDRNRILDLLASGRITAEEAARLLDALETSSGKAEADAAVGKTGWAKFFAGSDKSTGIGGHNYLFVKVVSTKGDNVNVKVPLGLLRAGLKFTSLIPKQAGDEINKAMRDKGMSFDISNFKPEDVEELITALGEMEIEVDSNDGDHVKVFVA